MAQPQPLARFETFARLHRATSIDLPNVHKFVEHLPSNAELQDDWYKILADQDDSYILIATECQLIVGVAAIQHAPSAPEARLMFLCVSPDARGRGVGQLLLSTLIGRARSEGAALVRAVEHGEAGVARALLKAGFSELGGGVWCLGLWNTHAASGYADLSIPAHEAVTPNRAAAQSLLLAMGTLDSDMLLTRRACQVIEHELAQVKSADPGAGALALAAARRRYMVWTEKHVTERLHEQSLPETVERIISEQSRLTPEHVLGHIARGHLCLLRLVIDRLSGRVPTWYLVNGFDGYLFRLHDVTRNNDPADPLVVTAAELRLAFGGLKGDDHIAVGKLL